MAGINVITKTVFGEKTYLLSALIQKDRMVDVRLEPSCTDGADITNPQILGNIYIARVQRVIPNLNAAFVDIAPGQSCYLSLEKAEELFFVKKTSKKPIAQNDEILVQVQKESLKSKAPGVSGNLTLTGRYCVLTLGNKKTGVSGKLKKTQQIHYKQLLSGNSDGKYGFIVRTNAQYAADEDILDEMRQLSDQMDQITESARMRTCYSCIYQAEPKYLQFIKNSYQENLDEVITDLPDIAKRVSDYMKRFRDLNEIGVRIYTDSLLPLAALYNLHRQLQRAVSKKVWLKSGGFLVIEPTEALTVIDVNTGKSVSKKEKRRHFAETNREASAEIAHQIRLRNISGIILIDYIDPEEEEERTELLSYLQHCVKADPIPVHIHDITKLGLVELTRKKSEKSLLEQLGMKTSDEDI